MIAVVDTSALLRLFIPDGPVPDGLVAFFREVESGKNVAIAPELLHVEAANVILKKLQRNELEPQEAADLLTILGNFPIRMFSHRPFLKKVLHTASATGLTAYDAMFLCLAEDRAAVLFTADRKLENIAAQRGVLPGKNFSDLL